MSPRSIAAGFLIAVTIAIALVIANSTSAYKVKIAFADAAGLTPGSLVEEAGQPVGSVTDLGLAADGHAIATVELRGGKRIGVGASAYVRPANLLGEMYVDLHSGDVARSKPSGSTIPVARTGSPVGLDDVVDVLDAPTRVALSELINESGIALTGRGGDFNKLLTELPPTLDATKTVVGQLASGNRALGELLQDGDRVVAALDAHRAALGALVQHAATILATTATHDRGLAATVARAPAAVTQLTKSLGQLEGTSLALGPASDTLRATAWPLHNLLAEVPAFTTSAVPTLRTAAAVAPALTNLGVKVTPVIARMQPLVGRLTSFASSLTSFSQLLQEALPDTLSWIEGWARSTQPADAAGHLFRNDLGFNLDALTALIGTAQSSPARATAPSRRTHHAPASPPASHTATARPSTPATPQGSSSTVGPNAPNPPPGGDLMPLLGYLLKR